MAPDAFDIIEKLDYVQPLAGGGVELHIAPRRGRLDGSLASFELLKRKLQFYLDQLTADGFQAGFQHPTPAPIVIVLLCEAPLIPQIVDFVARASEWVERNNAKLEIRTAVPNFHLDGILSVS